MVSNKETKLPKKIYLNYCDEGCDSSNYDDLSGITWCSEPVTVSDCDMKNREYTDLSQVWHDASEIPDRNHQNIIYQQKYCSRFNIYITYLPTCVRSCKITQTSWEEFVKENNVKRWAYTDELLPKIEEL